MINDDLLELNTYSAICGGRCENCPIGFKSKKDKSQSCLEITLSHALNRSNENLHRVSPQEWLDMMAYILDANNTVSAACMGVPCSECATQRFANFLYEQRISGCRNALEKFMEEQLVYWRNEA